MDQYLQASADFSHKRQFPTLQTMDEMAADLRISGILCLGKWTGRGRGRVAQGAGCDCNNNYDCFVSFFARPKTDISASRPTLASVISAVSVVRDGSQSPCNGRVNTLPSTLHDGVSSGMMPTMSLGCSSS